MRPYHQTGARPVAIACWRSDALRCLLALSAPRSVSALLARIEKGSHADLDNPRYVDIEWLQQGQSGMGEPAASRALPVA